MKRSAYVGLIILFFFLLAAAGTVFVLFEDIAGKRVEVPATAYLDVPLAGPVAEIAPADSLSALLLGSRPLAVHDFWENLRKAKVDRRIRAVVLRLGLLQCDWAKAAEMREAVLDFRRSGKKAYAVIEEAPDCDMEYFVATACDRIVLHPLGWLGINGLGGYVPFLKGALDKLGVRAEFEHVEEYKTAYNMFTEKGFTPAHREEMESYYGDLFAQYVAAAAEARGKTPEEFRALVDRGFFQGEKAKAAGLVDDCLYEDEFQDLLARDGRAPARIRFDDYIEDQARLGRPRDRPRQGRARLRRRDHHDRREPAPGHGRHDGRPLDPGGPQRRLGQGHRPARRQPGRLLGRLGRHRPRGRPGPESEARRRVHVGRGRLGRILDRHAGDEDRRPAADPDRVHRRPGRQVQRRRAPGEARRDRREARLRRDGRRLLPVPAFHARGAPGPQGRDPLDLRAVPRQGRRGPGPDAGRGRRRRQGAHLDRPAGQGEEARRRDRRADHGHRHRQEGSRDRRRRGRPPGRLAPEAHASGRPSSAVPCSASDTKSAAGQERHRRGAAG
ncbi:MAG: S49 family peptidase [Desulfobacterales bacterium]|nr:S49 family peptidase [Desulfobacterales bacterium]